jgi:hypothetical protein
MNIRRKSMFLKKSMTLATFMLTLLISSISFAEPIPYDDLDHFLNRVRQSLPNVDSGPVESVTGDALRALDRRQFLDLHREANALARALPLGSLERENMITVRDELARHLDIPNRLGPSATDGRLMGALIENGKSLQYQLRGLSFRSRTMFGLGAIAAGITLMSAQTEAAASEETIEFEDVNVAQ